MKLNDTLQRLMEELEKALYDIEEVAKGFITPDDMVKDSLLFRAARDATFISIQSAIDIGNRVILLKGLRKPESYKDIFQILKENGVISEELCEGLKDLTGLRNILVHLYWRLHLSRLFKFLKEDYRVLNSFKKEILKLFD